MLLHTFNLANIIKQYNITNKTHLSEDSTFGFTFFDSDILNSANTFITLLNEGHSLCLFNENEVRFIRIDNLEKNKLAKRILNLAISRGKTYSESSRIYSNVPYTDEQISDLKHEINKKLAWREWQQTQLTYLTNNDITITHADVKDVNNLKFNFSKHSSLAHFNDAAIYRIASEILPNLIEHQSRAKKKLKSNEHEVPKGISTSYLRYLNDFENNAKELQETLIESMLARLQAYDESRGRYTNPILHIGTLLNPTIANKQQPYTITNNEFNFFNQYIEKYGSLDAKNRLYRRSWYVSNACIPTTVVITEDNGCIIVPEKLASYVPLKQRWPNWLFGDANLRQKLFLDNTLLLANLNFYTNRPKYHLNAFDPKSLNDAINNIKNNEALLKESIAKISLAPYSKISWYSFGTKTFLNKWKNTLIEKESMLIEDKFKLAEEIVNFLKTTVKDPLTVPWESYKAILDLSQELEDLVNNNTLNEPLKERIFAINTTLSRFAPIKKFVQIFDKLASGELPTAEQLDYLYSYIDRHKESDVNFIDNFKIDCKSALDKILSNLIKHLKTDPFTHRTNADLDAHERSVISLYKVIERLNDPNINQNIENTIKKSCFLKYLQHLNSKDQHKFTKQFAVYKNIIICVGKNIKVLEEPLVAHMESLEKQKLENPLLFSINCKAMIISIGNHYLEKHFDKELVKLDGALTNEFKNKGFSTEVINGLLKRRDQLVQHTSLNYLNLSASERRLLGIDSSNSKSDILNILQCSATAYRARKELDNTSISSDKKPQFVKALGQSITQCLSKCQDISEDVSRKKWFAKQYIEESILANTTHRINH